MPKGVYVRTAKTRENISLSKKGKKPPIQCGFQKGHPLYKGAEKGWIKKGDKLGLGYKHTEEDKEKMRKARKGKKCPQLSGGNHYLWKGGTTPLVKAIRTCAKYKQWCTSIFQRDNWTCQTCGARNGQGETIYLGAHHTEKPFSELLREFLKEYDQFSPYEDQYTLLRLATKWQPFWDAEAITLCEDCHKLTDNYGWKSYNNISGG